jgi:NAD(P)H-quinone oxidoreductase subunit 6
VSDPIVSAVIFYALAAFTVGAGAVVALSTNIVHSGFALFATLFGVAGLYAYLSADLLAVVQMLVYVGGISVLVLFAVMLTSGLSDAGHTNPGARLVSGIVLLVAVLAAVLVLAFSLPYGTEDAAVPTTAAVGDALLGKWVLPFEVVSMVLLAALLGAVSLARGWRRTPGAPPAPAAREGTP